MRKLKNRFREKTPDWDHSVLSELSLPLRSLPPIRSRSRTPAAEGLPSIMPTSRFAPRTPVTTKDPSRHKTPPPTTRSRAKSPKPNGIRFDLDNDRDSQHESETDNRDEGEQDSSGPSNKFPKPPGEPGRPKSGGYKLETALGWNEATFEAIRVGLRLEKDCIAFTIMCLL